MASTTTTSSTSSTHYYFAIASMMNPTSLQNRGLHPLHSQPAVLLDYNLVFFGTMGFAEAIPSPRSSGFHGVVHTVTKEDIKVLTDMEGHLYKANKATAKLYDGTLLSDVVVFCRPDQRLDNDRVGTPQERYLNIMMEGAAHYGVSQDYIDSLGALEQEPRPQPKEFWSMGPVPSHLPAMSLEDAMKLDGQDDRPLAATVNGKAFTIVNPTLERSGLFRKMRTKYNSPAVEDFMPKTLYDPVYGVPQHRNECTRQHAAYLEHIVLQRLGRDSGVELIGSVPQSYKDEE